MGGKHLLSAGAGISLVFFPYAWIGVVRLLIPILSAPLHRLVYFLVHGLKTCIDLGEQGCNMICSDFSTENMPNSFVLFCQIPQVK